MGVTVPSLPEVSRSAAAPSSSAHFPVASPRQLPILSNWLKMAVRCLASHQMSTPLGTGPAAGSTSADQHPLVLVFHQHETSAHPPHTPATHWMSCGQDIFVMQSSMSDQAQWLRILPPHPHLGCPPFLRARRVILWWAREFIFSDCGCHNRKRRQQ